MKTTKKIGDFGQKIGGARKDLIRENIEILSQITDDALLVQPLSKVYRLPDLRSLFLSGAISANQARMCWFVWNQLTTKPKVHGVQRWVKETRILLQIIQDILSADRITLDGVFTSNIASDLVGLFFSEMEAANWPEEEYARGIYSVVLTPRYISEKPYAVNDGKYYRAYHLTVEEAVADIRRRMAASYGTSVKSPVLEVRFWTSSKEYFICPKGKPEIVLRRGLKNSEEARRVRNEDADELRAEYERLRTIPEVRDNAAKLLRFGEDYRAGQDMTPEAFAAKFPFRGVEFGNWVNQEERAECLNRCADALCDLAKITGLRTDALTHNQQLSLAFGSRGIAKAAAHYESGKRVINLTKLNGVGCLAHEWWHSLDNMMMCADGNPMLFSVSGCMKLKNKVLMQVAYNLYKALEQSAFAIRSRRIDTYKGRKYWGDMVELSARAFEAYVFYKLEAADMRNDYLVSFKPMNEFQRSELYPYPTREEAEKFALLFDAYIDVAFGESGKVQTVQPEAIEIVKEEPKVVAVDKPAYGMGEKSQLFPSDLVAFRKYFAKVEEFCRDRLMEYFFIRESDVKVRLAISMVSGDTMAFDYDTVSRHRDVFTLPADGSTRRRIQNWTVALRQIEAFPVAASYGVCEKSPNTPEEVQLPEEDKEAMRELNRRNDYCMSYKELGKLANKHERARQKGDWVICRLIEYRLTDINFHSECGMLYAGRYLDLREAIKEDNV
ncbi:LPD5 domain-containing protein [Bacteroides sp.]|uniref:LPD1 domain-containing protein n=1 Tax=Bacteroides sp. TaxID=29523 RepID=UPI00260F18A8|nr:LPD5 domain-containing protein [Bacteroides sp.]MDD3040906.1 LPD5 domain-containing protein [Bacteroides sp.]